MGTKVEKGSVWEGWRLKEKGAPERKGMLPSPLCHPPAIGWSATEPAPATLYSEFLHQATCLLLSYSNMRRGLHEESLQTRSPPGEGRRDMWITTPQDHIGWRRKRGRWKLRRKGEVRKQGGEKRLRRKWGTMKKNERQRWKNRVQEEEEKESEGKRGGEENLIPGTSWCFYRLYKGAHGVQQLVCGTQILSLVKTNCK